jgi:transcriptional regulator with PAS, ATPase and Fis domain
MGPEKRDQNHLAQHLLQLFFQAPLVNALLVFEDHDYLGIIFKKDIQIGITEQNFDLELNINFIDAAEVRDIILSPDREKESLKIPVVDKEGHLIKIISFSEFESQFYFNHFLESFSLEHIWDHMDHPLIITNHFNKVLYLNKEAFIMAGKDLLGSRLNKFLNQFEIEIIQDRMTLTRGDKMYHLVISHSHDDTFDYQIYQFFEI